MGEKRNFVLRDEEGNENGIFVGSQPRQAALKVANKGSGTEEKPEKIMLRERGTKKVHVFNGWRKLIDAPTPRPAWMPEKIYKPFVKKIEILRI